MPSKHTLCGDSVHIRRHVRALIRKYDILCEPGDCASACQSLAPLLPGARVVHGDVYYKKYCMQHVWLTWYQYNIDPTMMQMRLEMSAKTVPALGIWSITRTCPYKVLYVPRIVCAKNYKNVSYGSNI